MRKDPVFRFAAFAVCSLLILASGCGRTRIARFYTLSALTESRTGSGPAGSAPGIALGLGPVRLPEYLDRPQIVTRVSPHEVRFAEFHRWAGVLDEDFSRTLADNLSALLGTDRVALFPWKSTTPIDCRVEVEVSRFEGSPGKTVFLEAQWGLFSADRGRRLATKTSELREPVDGNGYEALVAAQSRALAALSREIALAVESLPGGAPAE